MSDVMSQEEIERMLSGMTDDSAEDTGSDDASASGGANGGASPDDADTYSYPTNDAGLSIGPVETLPVDDYLSRDEQDLLGELGNICMGTSATTMSLLLGRKVTITTPRISVQTMEALSEEYPAPLVVSEIKYVKGLSGDNLLILKEYDVALITNLMLGEDVDIDPDNVELNEIHMSAIGEVMNQMVGSSATALADITHQVVDISPPQTRKLELKEHGLGDSFPDHTEPFVKVSFVMEIEDLLTSEIMQILKVEFAKEMAAALWNQMQAEMGITSSSSPSEMAAASEPPQQQPAAPEPQPAAQPAPTAAAPPQQQMPTGYPDGYQQQVPPGYPPMTPEQQAYMQQMMMQGYPQQGYMQPGYMMPPPGYMQPGAGQGVSPVVQEPQNVRIQQPQFPSFTPVGGGIPNLENIEMIMDVPMSVTVELGRTKKKVKEILEYSTGSVVVLDRPAGDMVDILVNGKRIGRGEVVVIDDNYGVRISEINVPNAADLM